MELFSFQKKTAKRAMDLMFAKSNPTDAVFIIDEVGLGKTKEALEILRRSREKLRGKFKAIIITPSKRLISQWKKESREFNSEKQIFNIEPSEATRKLYESGKITLINAALNYDQKINLAFSSGNELKNFRSTNYLEREYIMSFFSKRKRGKKFFRKLGVSQNQIPDVYNKSFRKISRKDISLSEAIKSIKDQTSISEFKKRWLENIGERHKFTSIVVDEFHNYVNLAAKKNLDKISGEEKEVDYDIQIWDEFFRLQADDGARKVKKIYLSATPFKPIRLNIGPENQNDPISYILNGLSNSFTYGDQEKLGKKILNYNENVLEIRKKIAYLANNLGKKDINGKDIAEVLKDRELIELKSKITITKREIEKILSRYLLRNERKQKKFTRITIAKTIKISKEFDRYINLFEAMYRSRSVDQRYDGLQTYFTSGDFFDRSYKREHYKALENLKKKSKYLKKSDFRNYLKTHPKLEELKKIIREDLKWFKSKGNPPCWLDVYNPEGYSKALVFCGYRGTQNYLEKETKKEYEHKVKKIFKPSNVLKNTIEKMFKNITGYDGIEEKQRDIVENFYGYLPSYIKRWGLRKSERVTARQLKRYIKKNKLEEVLKYYFERVCDKKQEKFFENIKAITEWTLMQSRHGVIAKYGEMSGGKGKRSGVERIEDLRTAFNSPFYPYIMISTNAGSEGISLHSYCRNVIHYEQDWMPATIEQRSGRVDRINSLAARLRIEEIKDKNDLEKLKHSPHADHLLEPGKPQVEVCDHYMHNKDVKINIYRLVMEATIDEYMYNRERERALWVDLFVGGEDVNKMLDSSVGLNFNISDESVKLELDKLIEEIKIKVGEIK